MAQSRNNVHRIPSLWPCPQGKLPFVCAATKSLPFGTVQADAAGTSRAGGNASQSHAAGAGPPAGVAPSSAAPPAATAIAPSTAPGCFLLLGPWEQLVMRQQQGQCALLLRQQLEQLAFLRHQQGQQ